MPSKPPLNFSCQRIPCSATPPRSVKDPYVNCSALTSTGPSWILASNSFGALQRFLPKVNIRSEMFGIQLGIETWFKKINQPVSEQQLTLKAKPRTASPAAASTPASRANPAAAAAAAAGQRAPPAPAAPGPCGAGNRPPPGPGLGKCNGNRQHDKM